MGTDTDFNWRNVLGTRSRLLARNMEHTEAVHGFLAQLSRQDQRKRHTKLFNWTRPTGVPGSSNTTTRCVPSIPTPSASCERGIGRCRSSWSGSEEQFDPAQWLHRLGPYLRYYSGHDPLDDHGAKPIVLIVFDDKLVESRFLGVARREVRRTMVKLPLWVSHSRVLGEKGPLGPVWRNQDILEPTSAFLKVPAH